MKAKQRLPLIVKEVRFLPTTDETSRAKISQVLRLLLDATPAKQASDKNQQGEEK